MFLAKSSSRLIIILLIIFAILSLCQITNASEEHSELAKENLCVVLIIDISGSMADTDPQRLRETAANIFIDLLSQDDYLGIITFDDRIEVVVPIQKVASNSNKEVIKNTLSGKPDQRGNTDYTGAFEAAYDQLQQLDQEDLRPVVIFLTDGEPNPDSRRSNDTAFMKTYMESMWETVTNFTLQRYPIYSVAFSNEIDPDIINKISMDTKAEAYILDTPSDLAHTFYNLLGKLKNRNNIYDEDYLLTNTGETLSFFVDEYTNQVNLLFLDAPDSDYEIKIKKPANIDLMDEGITESIEDNYRILTLAMPGEHHLGEWEIEVSGRGSIRLMADLDISLKAWLMSPVPYSQHSLNESVEFKVYVPLGGTTNQNLDVTVELTKPGQDRPEIVKLKQENGYFIGIYDGANLAGTYDIQVNLLMDNKVVNTSSTKLYVKLLPSLLTDFWIEDGYRIGEEVIVTASLSIGGNRITESNDLKVESFNLVVDYEDGYSEFIALNDSGAAEHGDIRSADGIWSNRQAFDRAGIAEAMIIVVGEYRGDEFILEKKLGGFLVAPPGNIIINNSQGSLWSVSGGVLSIPLEIQNISHFKETLFIDMESSLGKLVNTQIVLEPEETKTLYINVEMATELEKEGYLLPLSFRTDNELTRLEANSLNVPVDIVSKGEYLLKKYYSTIGLLVYILIGFMAVAILIYALGLLLYFILIKPRSIISGELSYWISSDNPWSSIPKKVQLKPFKKNKVIVSFNPDNQQADVHVKNREFDYDIILQVITDEKTKRFIQGWKVLLKRKQPISLRVKCTQPGVLELNGEIYSQRDLHHRDKFTSGGFGFQYTAPSKLSRETYQGKNILEGKVSNDKSQGV
ncbi:MAG: hypothetical protein APF76_07720 [Desulfitibacter sp. BRH_c19]|nr:MAG: hypothetical protein APF76_07720 [Desulfitibacter sp. BRH_c19]